MLATRMAFGNELIELAKTNDSFMICNPDTKSCNLENFDQMFPGRSFTFGIAEQNLVAAAAGAASCGEKLYVPTFSVFLTLRACEQIRTFVCYPKLNVTLLGTHSGLQVGQDGGTHICCEDVGVMRSLANMTIVQPSDVVTAKAIARWSVGFDGPLYIRLHRSPVENVHPEDYEFRFGKADILRDYGDDIVLIATGIMLQRTLKAADELLGKGIRCKVLEVHTIKPIDVETISAVCKNAHGVVTVEDHSIFGGLGSAVAEVLSQHCPKPLKMIGVQDAFGESAKDPETLYAAHHMTLEDVVQAAQEMFDNRLPAHNDVLQRASAMRLNGKVIVVTGGADGIGRSLAYGIAKEGATAVIVDINREKLEKTKEAMRAEGLSCEAYVMNVTDEGQIAHVVSELQKTFGHIDGWVNNAGINGTATILETGSPEYDRIIAVNLKGVFLCCKAAGQVMADQGHGSIVNIASVAARTGGGLLGTSTYAASKGGVISFTKGIARELAPMNVRANLVAPGSIDTAMTLEKHTKESYEASIRKIPLHRRGTPEDIVGSVVFLLSDESSFMTGAALDVNGGSFMY